MNRELRTGYLADTEANKHHGSTEGGDTRSWTGAAVEMRCINKGGIAVSVRERTEQVDKNDRKGRKV